MLLLMILAAIVAAHISFFRPDSELEEQYLRVKEWGMSVNRSIPMAINVDLNGKHFGIANVRVKCLEDGSCVLTDEILPNGYYAYPPGKKVRTIEDAFSHFCQEMRK